MNEIVLCFITSFTIVLLSTPALIKVAYLKRLVDEPGEDRKVHKRRIPTIGGIIIFAGTLFSYLMWYPPAVVKEFQLICACMIILFFVGVKDDIIGTAPVKKLVAHLVVAFILVIMADIRITSMYDIFGIGELPYWASVLLSLFTYTVIVNAINLIDGVDGLAAGVGTIACVAFGVWFFMAGSTNDAVLAFSLVGTLLAFLVFNFSPAKIFMGDSGSLTIGLIVSVLSIKLIEYDVKEIPANSLVIGISKPVFAMAALFYPLVDTLRIFVYRSSKGISPFAADRNHLHHRLLELGLSHGRTVMVIYIASVSVVVLAAFLQTAPSIAILVVAGVSLGLSQIPGILLKARKKKYQSA